MLAEKIKKHDVKCWLINTGWSGGPYGVGKRMDLSITRTIIDSIHNGSIDNVEFQNFPVFNVAIPKTIPGISNDKLLNPRNTWSSV